MARALDALAAGTLRFTPQTETGVCYAHKIEKAEARLDWTLPASVLHNRIRGLSPFPGAYFEVDLGRGPERVKVLRATLAPGAGAPGRVLDENLTVACGAGALRLLDVQRAGKPALDAATFLRGTRIAAGQSLAGI
jgi:methionyl-tRNA formyltransferase